MSVMGKKILIGTFKGTNSLGYEKNKVYTLLLDEFSTMKRITTGCALSINRVTGDPKDKAGLCPYKTFADFLKNWQIQPETVKTIQ